MSVLRLYGVAIKEVGWPVLAIQEHDVHKALDTVKEHLLRARDGFLQEHAEHAKG